MLEDHSYDFDRQVRSLLEDAEVKAPGRVWRSVAGRLDAAGAAPAAGGWWRWAGAGLAFAAALVAGVFVFRGPGMKPAEQNLIAVRVLEDNSAPVFESIPSPAQIKGPAARHTAAPFSEQSEGISVMEAAQPQHAQEPEKVREAQNPTGSDEVSDGSAARMLAQLGWEDEHGLKNAPKSVILGGTLGGNESHFNPGRDHRSFMSYGTAAHSQTAVEETSTSAYGIPVSFGAGIRFQLAPRFSLGTGVTYSLLGRKFDGVYTEVKDGLIVRSETGEVSHKMQYLGIPVNAYYDFVQSKLIDLYAYAGGSMEFCVSNRYLIRDVVFKDPVRNLQFSLGAGLGLQFKFSEAFGIYFDPGVRYFFRCDQPKSVRTDKPFTVNLEAGLRFNLK